MALSLAIVGCTEAPVTLRIVSAPPEANGRVAELLVSASNEVATRVRVLPGAAVASAEAALAALDAGDAELAIVENGAGYRHPNVRTVAPLYPTVLHIGIRPERRGRTLREVLRGATVFAGTEDTAARQLLNRMASLYAWRGIEFSYVDALDTLPDVVFVFAPISPRLAPILDGYELLSLGRAEEVGSGSAADGLSLVAPFLRTFVIPEGTYGPLTPTAIATVAIDTLLVTRADTHRIVGYDLVQAMQTMAPLLASQRPDLALDELETFSLSHVTFPVHAGTLAFRARNDPGFAERASSIFDVAVTIAVAVSTGLLALVRFVRGRRKARIDRFYSAALAIRAKLAHGSSAAHRDACVAELRALRDNAFSLLIDEKLLPDESFRILEALIYDVIRECETPPSAHGALAEPPR